MLILEPKHLFDSYANTVLINHHKQMSFNNLTSSTSSTSSTSGKKRPTLPPLPRKEAMLVDADSSDLPKVTNLLSF